MTSPHQVDGVDREQRVELVVGQAVRVLAVRLQPHQVDGVHDAHPGPTSDPAPG